MRKNLQLADYIYVTCLGNELYSSNFLNNYFIIFTIITLCFKFVYSARCVRVDNYCNALFTSHITVTVLHNIQGL